MPLSLTVLLLILLSCLPTICAASIHLPLSRRGGRFANHEPAKLDLLANTLTRVEKKYTHTHRKPEHNHLVRKWSSGHHVIDDDYLFTAPGHDGAWYATLAIGDPPQNLEFDLDMLGPDLYTLMTTTSENTFIHSLCSQYSELFDLDALASPVRLQLPVCIAPKTSALTLLPSGSVLGLGLPGSLSRMPGAEFVSQLRMSGVISEAIWSITILDAETGILSLGSTLAEVVEEAKTRAEIELQHYGHSLATPEWVDEQLNLKLEVAMPEGSKFDQHFKWSDLSGAAGWWTSLMPGVWVNGVKVLRNQPVLFDVQCPFILAPPSAVSRFYDSIGGSMRLPAPHDNFFAFPCLNHVSIVLELGGWNFPSISGETSRADTLHGPAGGRFSLGKAGNGTGHCIGAVVETRMESRRDWEESGMRGTWVLGEPFFRSMGVVFDATNQRIGFRSY
ncbi:uncharacterized protein HMPREF1541_02689 [Cyphellophora europaea CBS 101466]|uniref:Peptidase A1 domain-containing protein n=1 Tax=Cyphellophora europaea (strain CBS 101466) TaxID=1220924 RepID=W2S4K7_CYPE1|nr:uncharacterized protein HMPREF1541_02689 [Cyphellophora europaea CBS 101466]ETN43530.1 hypothetical protein HMPREF1541_02689 [Cyphellophora europaea CBS 101466]